MPADQAPTYFKEIPLSAFIGDIGRGPVVPQTVAVSTPGSTALSSYNVPAGMAVQIYLVGAGGGGASGDDDTDGGGGGGGGGGVVALVPAELWALGGTLVIGAGGAGGDTPPEDGANGTASTLTIDSVLRLTAGFGHGGTSALHGGGAGGTVTVGTGVTASSIRTGKAGSAGVDAVGGAGGRPGLAGGGAGGAGGAGPSAHGVNGGGGYCQLTFPS